MYVVHKRQTSGKEVLHTHTYKKKRSCLLSGKFLPVLLRYDPLTR